ECVHRKGEPIVEQGLSPPSGCRPSDASRIDLAGRLATAAARAAPGVPRPRDRAVATLRSMATIEQPHVETDEIAGLTLTERAAGKVRAMMELEPAGTAEVLRVAIRGGGCGGFEYALGFDRGAAEGDRAYEHHGVTVVVDSASAPYLKGATV